MKKILKIKANTKEFIIEDIMSSYLFNIFFIFIIKNNIVFSDNNEILIDKNYLNELNGEISKSLSKLLEYSYTEPSLRNIEKNPTRFEKIFLFGNTYKVNYRMSETGRLSYAIFCLINFIEEAAKEKMNIVIEYM